MKLWSLTLALSVAAPLLQVTEAYYADIQYYYDQSCTSYIGQWDMYGPTNTCLGYYVAGAGSFNIARCTPNAGDRVCQCEFFTNGDCTGNTGLVTLPGTNCANTGQMIYEPRSVICYSIP